MMKTITYPAGNYMFKVNIRNTRARCEICSKLTIKTPERCHWRRSGVFIVNLEHISHLVLVFLLITLSRQMPAGVLINLNFRTFFHLPIKCHSFNEIINRLMHEMARAVFHKVKNSLL